MRARLRTRGASTAVHWPRAKEVFNFVTRAGRKFWKKEKALGAKAIERLLLGL
jgi:hypothetical protein